jgi:uncharacterized membrane protein
MTSFLINIAPQVVAGQRIAAIDELKGLALVLILLYHGGGVIGAPIPSMARWAWTYSSS